MRLRLINFLHLFLRVVNFRSFQIWIFIHCVNRLTSGFFKSSELLFGHIDMVIVTTTTKRSTCQFKFSKMHIFVYKIAIRSINLAHFFIFKSSVDRYLHLEHDCIKIMKEFIDSKFNNQEKLPILTQTFPIFLLWTSIVTYCDKKCCIIFIPLKAQFNC